MINMRNQIIFSLAYIYLIDCLIDHEISKKLEI